MVGDWACPDKLTKLKNIIKMNREQSAPKRVNRWDIYLNFFFLFHTHQSDNSLFSKREEVREQKWQCYLPTVLSGEISRCFLLYLPWTEATREKIFPLMVWRKPGVEHCYPINLFMQIKYLFLIRVDNTPNKWNSTCM